MNISWNSTATVSMVIEYQHSDARGAHLIMKEVVKRKTAKTTPNQHSTCIRSAIFTAPAVPPKGSRDWPNTLLSRRLFGTSNESVI
jgi:hypothetical protein